MTSNKQMSQQTAPTHSHHIPVRAMLLKKGYAADKGSYLLESCDTLEIDQGQHRLHFGLVALLSTDQYLSAYDALKTAFQLDGSCGQGHAASILAIMFARTDQITCKPSPKCVLDIV